MRRNMYVTTAVCFCMSKTDKLCKEQARVSLCAPNRVAGQDIQAQANACLYPLVILPMINSDIRMLTDTTDPNSSPGE